MSVSRIQKRDYSVSFNRYVPRNKVAKIFETSIFLQIKFEFTTSKYIITGQVVTLSLSFYNFY